VKLTSLAQKLKLLGVSVEEVWEAYGGFLIQFTMETGWDELLRTLSKDLKVGQRRILTGFLIVSSDFSIFLKGFLDNLDSLHYFIDHIVYKANLQGPSFRCEENADGSLTLHYYSRRTGLFPIVKG